MKTTAIIAAPLMLASCSLFKDKGPDYFEDIFQAAAAQAASQNYNKKTWQEYKNDLIKGIE